MLSGRLRIDQRRARRGGVLDVDHVRQFLVLHPHRFGGVARLLQGFGHHQRHGFADEAHSSTRQHVPRRRVAGVEPSARMKAAVGSGLTPAATSSAPVTTFTTPGMAAASAVSIEAMRACGYGERTKTSAQLPGGREVVGVLAQALEQAFVLDALHGPAAAEARGCPGCRWSCGEVSPIFRVLRQRAASASPWILADVQRNRGDVHDRASPSLDHPRGDEARTGGTRP